MRKAIPPEVDDLMWTLAESGNDKAIEEFGDRYPKLRGDLTKRIETVRWLKKANKPAEPKPKSAPFTPKEHIAPDTSQWARVAVWSLALLAIGAVAFVATMLLTKDPIPEPVKSVAPSRAKNAPQDTPRPTAPKVDITPNASTSPVPDPVADAATVKRVNIKLTDAPLSSVFELIQVQAGIKVIADKNVPNPNVTIEFYSVSPMEVLTTLGRQHGFTAFDQHDGTIVVVPGQSAASPGGTADHRRIGG